MEQAGRETWSFDELAASLADVPEATLAAWYVDLNQWRWPQTCPVPCPRGWQSATVGEQQQLSHTLWDYIHTHTTAQARSRAWWMLALQRSEAEWCQYWALPVCARCQLRHSATACPQARASRAAWVSCPEGVRTTVRRLAGLVLPRR